MAIVGGSSSQRAVSRAGLYLILSAFAALMLAPFVIMLATSLKSPEDVFNYPPRVLPRQQATVDIDGEPAPLYEIPYEGGTRVLALTSDSLEIGTFAPPDALDQTVAVLARDVAPTGGFTDPQTAVVEGEEQDLFDVEVDGEVVPMVQLSSTTVGEFTDPEDPGVEVLANIRTSTPVSSVSARPQNYTQVREAAGLDRSLTNTALVTLLVVVGQVFTSIMGGYAFARIRFPGRDQLFLVYLGSIMIPFVVLIIPLYQLMVAIGWVDTMASLTIPWLFTAYGTFLMRQFFLSIPRELEEAAFVDGASRWTVLWRVFVPLSLPAIATQATFGFLYAWNSFVWPLVVINAGNAEDRVLTLALSTLGGRAADSPNLVLAGVAIAVVVPVVVFVLAQRYFVENVAASGIK